MLSKRSLSAALCVLVAGTLAGCGGGGEKSSGGGGTGGCTDVEKPEPREAGGLELPTTTLDRDATYRVVVETNCGDFTITLDQRTSPKTAASFVSLVRRGYFDGTIFHRIVPNFVVQGGDPTGKGSGGPGYSTVDPPPRATRYVRNTVAMAKTSTEPAGTAGSQFFIVTSADAHLSPDYAVLGKVTSGDDVVERIGKLGDVQTQEPTRTVEIEKMSVQGP